MPELVCDFCSEPLPVPVRTYCADGVLSGQLYDGREFVDADGLWGACQKCTDLIDASRFDELIERAVDGAYLNVETRDMALRLSRDHMRKRCKTVWATVFGWHPELFEKKENGNNRTDSPAD